MLFPSSAAVVVLAFPMLAASNSKCPTGSVQCCNSIQSVSNPLVQSLASLLGITLGSATGHVGLACSSVSIIGVGGTSCSAQPVCCTGNSFNGLIVLGCAPININA